MGPEPALVANERRRRPVLAAFTDEDHRERPHRTLRPKAPVLAPRSATGPLRVRPVPGGPRHVYERAA